LKNTWKTPILVITEKEPDEENILTLINKLNYDNEYSSVLKNNPKHWIKIDNSRIYALGIDLTETDLKKVIKKMQTVGHIPEPVRIADIFAKAIR
jgi:endonuclease V-like protein UPF0215 family